MKGKGQDHDCDAPFIRIEDAEAGVLRDYASLVLPDGFAERVREVLEATLATRNTESGWCTFQLGRRRRDEYQCRPAATHRAWLGFELGRNGGACASLLKPQGGGGPPVAGAVCGIIAATS
jgi:hypothetical protein